MFQYKVRAWITMYMCVQECNYATCKHIIIGLVKCN